MDNSLLLKESCDGDTMATQSRRRRMVTLHYIPTSESEMTPQVDSLLLFSLEHFVLRISVTYWDIKDRLILPGNDLLDSST